MFTKNVPRILIKVTLIKKHIALDENVQIYLFLDHVEYSRVDDAH